MKEKILRKISIYLIALITISLISNIQFVSATSKEDNEWSIKILNMEIKNKLSTNEAISLYTGDVQEIFHENVPSNLDSNYLLITLEAKANINTNKSFNINDLEIVIDNKTYSQVDNKFLVNHGYDSFAKNDIRFGSHKGTILFEVDKNVTLENEWDLKYKDNSINIEIDKNREKSDLDNEITNIENKSDEIDEQMYIEKQIIEGYKSDSYTLQKPFVINNPYKISPLSALIIFETLEPSSIKLRVFGKDDYSMIEKSFNSYNTHHEIPILGLYSDSVNKIEIEAESKNGTVEKNVIEVTTEKLPDNFINFELLESKPEKMQEGFTFLNMENGNPVAIDGNADVRWFLSEDSLHVLKRLKNGNMLLSNNSILKEVNMLGKIIKIYNVEQRIHHDIIELPSGNFLAATDSEDYLEDRIIEIDRESGYINNTIDLKEIFDIYRYGDVLNHNDQDCWFHLNSIWYDEKDESIIISGRAQDLIAKIDYKNKKLKWILSNDKGWKEKYKNKLLKPQGEEFEFSFGQHSAMIIEDQDNNEDTLEILLFDNDTSKLSEDFSGNDSRAVIYSINENEMKVNQLWEYKNKNNLFSDVAGDADLLPNGNFLITFSDLDIVDSEHNTSNIIEIDNSKNNDTVFEVNVHFNNNRVVYRAERINMYPENLNINLASQKGKELSVYKINDNNLNLEKFNYNKRKLGSNNKTWFDEIYTNNRNELFIKGWSVIEGVDSEKSKISLAFRSDNDTKYIRLSTYNRSDVTKSLNNKNNDNVNYDNCAYKISLPFEYIQDNLNSGKYTIGILIENGTDKEYVDTNYYFTVSDKRSYEIDKNVRLEQQSDITNNISNEFSLEDYTIDNPLVVQNPYNTSPLTALIMFKSDIEGSTNIKIEGKDEYTSISHEFNQLTKEHILPVYGLYPDYNNEITITFVDKKGYATEKKVYIQTDKLPEDMQTIEVKTNVIENMKDGLTFVSSNYATAYDSNGDVRWYFTKGLVLDNVTPIKRLKNGNLVMMSGRGIRPMYYQTGFYELDLFGRIHNEYIINGIHHEIQELSNGNFIVLSEKDENTTEDCIVEINRKTGEIDNQWDIGDILKIEKIADPTYQDRTYQDRKLAMKGASEETIKNSADYINKHDWFHNNAIYYDELDNSIIVSGRMQDMVFKFDAKTKEIKWVLSNPNSTWSDVTENKLLTPIGDDFEWQYGQHAVTLLPNGDVMLYDNGNFRSKDSETSLSNDQNYSRGVIYRINEENMTVEQIWQYGKERGSELFTPYIGDVDYLDDNHYLINFGGIIKDNQENRLDSPVELFSRNDVTGEAVIVEVKDDMVVNEFKLTAPFNANTYRVERLPLYYENEKYVDLNIYGKSLGEYKETTYEEFINIKFENNLVINVNKIVDEGDRIIFNIGNSGIAFDSEKMYIVLDNGAVEKYYEIDSNVDFILNKEGLSKSNYNIKVMIIDGDGLGRYTYLNKRFFANYGSKIKYYKELILSKIKNNKFI